MSWQLQDQVTLITGATGYLARALAAGFSAAGATVFLTGRNEETLAVLAREHGRVHTLAADLTENGAVDQLLNRVLAEAGRIDTLIINAGTLADGLVAGLTDGELS